MFLLTNIVYAEWTCTRFKTILCPLRYNKNNKFFTSHSFIRFRRLKRYTFTEWQMNFYLKQKIKTKHYSIEVKETTAVVRLIRSDLNTVKIRNQMWGKSNIENKKPTFLISSKINQKKKLFSLALVSHSRGLKLFLFLCINICKILIFFK